MVSEDILEVTEYIHNFKKTKESFWYYDIKNWKKSSHGKKNDIPDRLMTEGDIGWVTKHYLPKVKKEN
jgi:hypothetical protein